MLLNFARVWILDYQGQYRYVFISSGLLLALIKYWLVFKKMADRNLDRINRMGPKIPLYKIYTPSTYILIVLMMAAGIIARITSMPRVCLGTIDIAIGLGLFLGALRFFYGMRKTGQW